MTYSTLRPLSFGSDKKKTSEKKNQRQPEEGVGRDDKQSGIIKQIDCLQVKVHMNRSRDTRVSDGGGATQNIFHLLLLLKCDSYMHA